MPPVVIGITGCTASGKSTIATELCSRLSSMALLDGDAFFADTSDPSWAGLRYDMRTLPWPNGLPRAFQPSRADTNSIHSMDVPQFKMAFEQAMSSADVKVLLVDSFLLLHFPFVVDQLNGLIRCGHEIDEDPEGLIYMRRKFGRNHRGTSSYEARGVTLDEYKVYWSHCVWPRFLEYREREPPLNVPCLMVDTRRSLPDCVTEVLQWLDQQNVHSKL